MHCQIFQQRISRLESGNEMDTTFEDKTEQEIPSLWVRNHGTLAKLGIPHARIFAHTLTTWADEPLLIYEGKFLQLPTMTDTMIRLASQREVLFVYTLASRSRQHMFRLTPVRALGLSEALSQWADHVHCVSLAGMEGVHAKR